MACNKALFYAILIYLVDYSAGWITSYPYILADLSICQREQPDVVMWVQGRATSITHRNVIRQMMANKKLWPNDIRVVTLFFVGISKRPDIQSLLEYEFEFFGDIIQNHYLEHYENQTAKMMSAMNFISDYCANSKISVRIDDDVIFEPTNMIKSIIKVLNQNNKNTYDPNEKYHEDMLGDSSTDSKSVPPTEDVHHYREISAQKLHTHEDFNHQYSRAFHSNYSYYSKFSRPNEENDLRKQLHKINNNTIVCHILHHKIARAGEYKLDKRYLPTEIWFPEYCAGFFIVFTTDVMPKLKHMFHLEPPFWIDDAYLGVIQKRLRTTNVALNRRLRFDPSKRRNIRTEVQRSSRLAPLVIHLGQRQYYRRLGEINLITEWGP